MNNKSNSNILYTKFLYILIGIGLLAFYRYIMLESNKPQEESFLNWYFLGIIAGLLAIYIIYRGLLVVGSNCSKCKGTGKKLAKEKYFCNDCDGTGKVVVNTWVNSKGENVKVFKKNIEGFDESCPYCYGGYKEGEEYQTEENCNYCGGKGIKTS